MTQTYLLTPHARYASALRRFERLRRDHPERRARHVEMTAAAEEYVAFERGLASNLEREHALAMRRVKRKAKPTIRQDIAAKRARLAR